MATEQSTKTQQQVKEERMLQTNQIFNMAERPVMEFIAKFLDETPNVLFRDELPTYVEPLILMPFEGYKDDICIKFTIKPVILTDDQPEPDLTIDSIIEHQRVKEGIGFLFYCIKEAYSAIISSAMINNKPMDNITMDLNETDWVFYPKYSNDLTTKKSFLEDALGKLMYINQNIGKFPPDMVAEITQEFPKVTDQLTAVNDQITPELIATDQKINDSYADRAVLGIFVEEIHRRDLPKPILSPDDEKNNAITDVSDETIDQKYDIENNVKDLFIED
jgi:hypothetical protein